MSTKAKPKPKAVSAKIAAAELSGESVAVEPRAPTTFVLPEGLKVRRVVTMPSLVMKNEGQPRILMFASEFRISDVKGKKLPDGSFEKPATVCNVTDIETGEQLIFLIPAVVQKNLEDGYPDDSYIGKTFYIENLGKRSSSQRYNDFKIVELESA